MRILDTTEIENVGGGKGPDIIYINDGTGWTAKALTWYGAFQLAIAPRSFQIP